jgi:hypothetical protein
MNFIYYSMRLNETRKNLAANPGRSPALVAGFPLAFVSCMQYAG